MFVRLESGNVLAERIGPGVTSLENIRIRVNGGEQPYNEKFCERKRKDQGVME